MKLQRVRIDQLRQFRQPLEISEFTAGLNLFSGPNESGKSTLVQAIRAAFFEKHRSGSVSDLQPWGDSSAAPQVEVDFEHNDESWRLIKRFLQRKRCDLKVNNRDYSGEEAEEKLAALLGFQLPGKGASKAEHWGIPGLLWIEQGQGQDMHEAVLNAGDHLKSALGASLGEIASSGGDDVIAEVEAQRAKVLTKTGRPTGDYSAAIQKLEELTPLLQALDGQIAHYKAQVDRLGELRQLHSRDERQRPWENLRLQQREAQARFDQVSQLNDRQQLDSQSLEGCRGNIRLISDQLGEFHKRAEQLQEREKARDRAQRQLEQLAGQQQQILDQLERAKTEYSLAREREKESIQRNQRQSLARESAQVGAHLESLKSNLEQARRVRKELLAAQKEHSACGIDGGELKQLKTLDAQLQTLRIQQKSIATRLKFELAAGQTLTLDGVELRDSGEQLLLQQAQLDIAGVGRIQIIPGGEDLGDLARRLEKTQERFDQLLHSMGMATLADAEQQQERFKTLTATIAHHNQLLASHAPRGVDALEAELTTLQERAALLQSQLAALPDLPTDNVLPPKQAEEEREEAAQNLKAAEAAEQEYQRQRALAEQQAKSANEEYQHLKAILADPREIQREKTISQQLLELRAQETELKARVADTQQRIDSARPDILQQDIKRFGASAEQAEVAFRERDRELTALQAELSALGAQGLEEERARLGSEFEAVTRRHQQLKRRAEATSLLLELLKDKRHQLTRRLQEPLQRHLNHYLQLLFPHASLEVDENLMPGQLIRQGVHGPEAGDFNALSFGAREQMGLITRLAYADMLKDAGKPTLIILDDALVHSDEQRLSPMKRILFDASQRHQILLFTCHPEKWVDMGVPIRELASL